MDDKLVRSLLSSVPILVIISVVLVSVLGWSSMSLKLALILSPYRVVKKGHIHRLLTAGWLHADGSHLFFNMLTLYLFAGDVERVLGATRFLVLYVSSVVVAFIPTTLRYMKKPEYASLGASGAVAAVMFSAILLVPKMKLYAFPIPFPIPAVFYALGYLAYSVWHSYHAKDNVNHDAHFTGAAYGALLTWLFEPARVERALRQLW